jgi:hypothetical protein
MEGDKSLETPLNLQHFGLVFIIEKGKGLFLAKNLLGTGRHPDSGKTNHRDAHEPCGLRLNPFITNMKGEKMILGKG